MNRKQKGRILIPGFVCLIVIVLISGCGSGDQSVPEVNGEFTVLHDPRWNPVTVLKPEQFPLHPGVIYAPGKVDLSSKNMFTLDLRERGDLIKDYADFDTATRWPLFLRMPKGFSPKKTLERGKNPGLGVRSLHRQGITGDGVRVAVIDQTLLVQHEDYASQIRFYAELGEVAHSPELHASAAVSILAGKSVGVAPGVEVFYYAAQNVRDNDERTFSYIAEAIERIIVFNQGLHEHEKIKIIALSTGWHEDEDGYEAVNEAVHKAKEAGIFVISSVVEQYYSFKFHGMDRLPEEDPDDINAYQPGIWWREQFYSDPSTADGRVMVPMDARTTAGFKAYDDYIFYRQGGWSWCTPYIAGLYALALQVKPELTPDQFYRAALDTGRFVDIEYEGESYRFGPIVDPQALVNSI